VRLVLSRQRRKILVQVPKNRVLIRFR